MSGKSDNSLTPMTRTLSEYISAAATRDLPPAVIAKTGHHILDSLAAIISGSRLRAGELAINYVKRLGGTVHSLAFLIAWELMSLSSLLLVIFEHQNKNTINAGINYLIQMHIGVVFLCRDLAPCDRISPLHSNLEYWQKRKQLFQTLNHAFVSS